MNLELFAQRVRDLRGGTPQNLAGPLCGLGSGTFCSFENRRHAPSTENLIKVADYFRVSVDYLVGKTDSPEITPAEKRGVFSRRIQLLRAETGLTQPGLAAKCGIAETSVQGYEYGTTIPGIVNLEKIADCFQTSIDFLLGRTDARAPGPPSVQIPAALPKREKTKLSDAERARKYRQEHRDRVAASRKRYRERNRYRLSEINRIYREENRIKINARKRERYRQKKAGLTAPKECDENVKRADS